MPKEKNNKWWEQPPLSPEVPPDRSGLPGLADSIFETRYELQQQRQKELLEAYQAKYQKALNLQIDYLLNLPDNLLVQILNPLPILGLAISIPYAN